MKLSEFKAKENSPKEEKKEDISSLYNKYKNLSQDELLNELNSTVKNQKQNGAFDYDKLKSSVEQILPYLGEEQKKNILSILENLK